MEASSETAHSAGDVLVGQTLVNLMQLEVLVQVMKVSDQPGKAPWPIRVLSGATEYLSVVDFPTTGAGL